MSLNPQRHERPAFSIGPIEFPRLLSQPSIGTDYESTTGSLDPIGTPTIIQQMSEGVRTYSISNQAFLPHANAIDLLTAGGPYTAIADTLGGAESVFVTSTSTSPVKWRPERGQYGYKYQIEAVEATLSPADAEQILPRFPPTSTTAFPAPRDRISARFGDLELPAPLNYPMVSIDTKADVSELKTVGGPVYHNYRGRESPTVTIEGPADRDLAFDIKRLRNATPLSIRTDRFLGLISVESITTTAESLYYAPGNFGHKYEITGTHIPDQTGEQQQGQEQGAA